MAAGFIRESGMSAMFPAHHKSAEEAVLARAVFIDKDGTLVDELLHNVDPAKLHFTPHAVEGLRLLRKHGYELIVVSNQPGLAFGEYTSAKPSTEAATVSEHVFMTNSPFIAALEYLIDRTAM